MRNSVLRLSGLFLATLLAASCQTTDNLTGSGPIEFSPGVQRCFDTYLSKERSYAFAVAIDGSSSCGDVFCKETQCGITNDRRWRAIEVCERSSGGVPCKIYAIRDSVVWKSGLATGSPSAKSLSGNAAGVGYVPKTRDWLTGFQLDEFGKYLRVLENSKYPVGVFIVADDGNLSWKTWDNQPDALERATNWSFERCQDRSSLPETCKIFAENTRLAFTNIRVTSENYRNVVRLSSGLVEDVEAAPRNMRVSWANLGPAFEFVTTPEYEQGKWLIEFHVPTNGASCDASGVMQSNGNGTWQAECDNGLSASGETRYDPKARTAINEGKDSKGGDVYVYSVPVPKKF